MVKLANLPRVDPRHSASNYNRPVAMDRRALIDERIRTLLTSTDLTFKQIIEQLRSEKMSASFNTIRRVNRNHRYRKPRYDAKLTPQQRKELIVKLRNTTRPNLSSLARQYGVCHGSIWYWWDKLSKIREKSNGQVAAHEPALDFDDMIEQEFMSGGSGGEYIGENEDDYDLMNNLDSDPLDLDEDNGFVHKNTNISSDNDTARISAESPVKMETIGPVLAKSIGGEYIKLPIIMYTSMPTSTLWTAATSLGSASSALNLSSEFKTGTETSSLSRRLRAS